MGIELREGEAEDSVSILPLLLGNTDAVVFQLNRIITGSCLIFISRDDNLAVEMGDFWGEADSGMCELFWRTESEVDNKGFKVLRRIAPKYAAKAPKRLRSDTTFRYISTFHGNKALKGQLTKATRTDYAFVDKSVELGQTYEYALEAVDINNIHERYKKTVILTVDKTFAFDLERNYPNPFNPVTTIHYSVPGRYSKGVKQHVKLRIYDIRGRLIKTLVSSKKRPYRYRIQWNGKANNGRYVASGVYFYRIEVGDRFMKTRKMVVVK